MNDNNLAVQRIDYIEDESINFEILEKQLQEDLVEQMEELDILKNNAEKIENPDTLGEVVLNVVWDQVINQIGVVAGEDFIKENRNLKLDLRDPAHIQTADNFTEGRIATHNYISREQLEQNYDRFKNNPHGKFRDEYVDKGMDATLKRAGILYEKGIETVTDIYTGRQIPTQTKLENGKNNPKAAQREHVKSSSECYENPSLQMANTNENLAAIINDPENLQGYTTAERNNRKSDHSADTMEDRDKNKHWEKADKKAKEYIEKKEKEGEDRLKAEGRKTQKEEAFRIGGKALRAVIMGLLAALIKDIIKALVEWFRAGQKNFRSFIEKMKDAIQIFFSNIKQRLCVAIDTLLTTILTSIIGSIVNLLKKAYIFFKQGCKSIKDAINYIKDPVNKNKPFEILLLEVGKIITGALTVGGTIVLGETIEKLLMTVPVLAFEIPFLGSLASILGIFFGALVSGIIGAIVINLIDRRIAKKQRNLNKQHQFEKRNEVILIQEQLMNVSKQNLVQTKSKNISNINERHRLAKDMIEKYLDLEDEKSNNGELPKKTNEDKFNDIFNDLNNL